MHKTQSNVNIEAIRSMLLSVDLGSFAAAGSQMKVPPSTISRRVNDLEADIGQKVLVRTGRGVRVADDAQETIVRLRDVLLAVDACYKPSLPMKRLRVTAPVGMSISLLPSIVPKFRTEFPDVVIEIRGDNRSIGLIEEDFDLAIRANTLQDSSYLRRKLPSDRFVVVATPKIASEILSVQQLESTPTVEVIGPSPVLSGHWKGEPFSILSKPVAKFDSFFAALPVVLSGQAYASMPAHLVRDFIVNGSLKEVDDVQLKEVLLHALYPRRHREQPPLLGFIDAVSALLGKPIT